MNGPPSRPRSRASIWKRSTSGAIRPAASNGAGSATRPRASPANTGAPCASTSTRSASPRNSSAEWLTTTTPALARMPAHDLAHRSATAGVEPGGRLVEQQVARAHREHAGDRGPARLAAGQRERRATAVRSRDRAPPRRAPRATRSAASSAVAPRLRGPNATSASERLGEQLGLGVLEDEADGPARSRARERRAVEPRGARRRARAARRTAAAASTCPTRSTRARARARPAPP